jgi:ribosome-associated protein YbcJ (S4-like RNA binding protein)
MCNPDGTQVKRRKRKLFQGVIVEASDTREVSNGLKGMTFV